MPIDSPMNICRSRAGRNALTHQPRTPIEARRHGVWACEFAQAFGSDHGAQGVLLREYGYSVASITPSDHWYVTKRER